MKIKALQILVILLTIAIFTSIIFGKSDADYLHILSGCVTGSCIRSVFFNSTIRPERLPEYDKYYFIFVGCVVFFVSSFYLYFSLSNIINTTIYDYIVFASTIALGGCSETICYKARKKYDEQVKKESEKK